MLEPDIWASCAGLKPSDQTEVNNKAGLVKPFNAVNTFVLDYHDAVFVVGSLDETLILRGMRYHPIDIENSVMKAHKKIAEW